MNNRLKKWVASRFCKSITQSNDNPRVSAPLKKANVQKWDAPKKWFPLTYAKMRAYTMGS
ncbi:MAG TPA: hypothetical protein DCF68_18720 [Cyanothece sp. UBA12306]|nr:hypothetical protein [Cyanothece sp. UBA12306]